MFYSKVKKNGVEIKFVGIEAMNEFATTFATLQLSDFSFKEFYESSQLLLIIKSYNLIEKRIEISNLSIEMKTLFQNKLKTFYDCILKYPLEQIVGQVDKSPFLKDEVTSEIKIFTEAKSTSNTNKATTTL